MMRQKRKRWNAQETLLLERIFEQEPFPDLSLRQELARLLDRTPRSVQIWFQNRRNRFKKQKGQRPQRTLHLRHEEGQLLSSLPQQLGEKSKPFPYIPDWNPLLLAVRNNQLSVVENLLGLYPINLQTKDSGQTALHIAVENQAIEMVELLLQQPGIDVNVPDLRGHTPLYLAIDRIPTIATLLMKAGAHIPSSNWQALTASDFLHCLTICEEFSSGENTL